MPEDVRTKFKSECVLDGVSMSEKAVELIQQWLQEKTQSKQKTGWRVVMSLDDKQSQHLLSLINGLEILISATDQDGAEEVLDELYVLLTKIYERFPELDTDEE